MEDRPNWPLGGLDQVGSIEVSQAGSIEVSWMGSIEVSQAGSIEGELSGLDQESSIERRAKPPPSAP